MKQKTTLLVLFALFISSIQAQQYIKVPLAGVSKEIEQKLLPHDIIPSDKGLNNISLRLKNEGQKGWKYYSGNIYTVKYNADTKHYDTEGVELSIKPKSEFYSLDKPVIILVTASTVYGNTIWTQVRRTPENLTDPITLDQYSSIEGKTTPGPSYKLILSGKALPSYVFSKMFEGEELIKKLGGLTIKLKNRAHQNYVTTTSYTTDSKGYFFTKVPLGAHIDPAQPIEALISYRTNYGNYIWTKYNIEHNRARRKVNTQYQYSGIEGNSNAALSKTEKAFTSSTTTTTTTTTTTVTTTTTTTSNSENPEEVVQTEDKTQSSPETVEEVAPKNELKLIQHKGVIELAKVPHDSIKGNIKTTLVKDATITVGNQKVDIKGGSPINFNNTKKYVISAVANNDQTITTDYGDVVIKGGELVSFSPYRITGFHLKEDSNINTNYGKVKIKAAHKPNVFDLTLTESGKLSSFTLAEDKSFLIGDHLIATPLGSSVKMSNDKILTLNTSQDIPFEIANLKLSITRGSTTAPSITFNTKNATITRVFAASSSDIATSDGPLKVDQKSAISFIHNGDSYSVTRFKIGETKDINTYRKNGKVKIKTAKKGKSIILVDGKVRRIGW